MCWHKLGEVEIEYTSEKPVLSAIFVPKIFTIRRSSAKLWRKISLHSFFETRCRVTRWVVNDFKWHINYVKAIRSLLSCFQCLGKFNAILCVKYHNRSLLTWFIRANIVTSPTKSSDCNKADCRNREGSFSRMALVRIHQRIHLPGWTQILNTIFRWGTGRLIHRICLRLRTFGALWQQPFMPTPSLASIEAPSTKSMESNFSVNTSKSYRFDA